MAKRLTAFPYYGGKFHLIPILNDMIPPHKTYIEVFGGAANFLLNKKRSPIEILNDLNSHIVSFFNVLRDEVSRKEFEERLKYVPFSREVFNDEKAKFLKGDFKDEVDRAICWFVGTRQAMSAIPFKSWKVGKTDKTKLANIWENSKKFKKELLDRLKGVSIENNDFSKVIKTYDSVYSFFYNDPPYIGVQRSEMNVYPFEMTDSDHVRFLKAVLRSKGMFLISGYENDLYDDYLRDWSRIDVNAKNWSVSQGSGYKSSGRGNRVESLWFNYIINSNKLREKFGSKALTIVR